MRLRAVKLLAHSHTANTGGASLQVFLIPGAFYSPYGEGSAFFLGPCLQHIEVPSLGVELELQLLATATAMPDLSCICNLHYSSQQHQILNPLSQARDQTYILMDTVGLLICCATTGTPKKTVLLKGYMPLMKRLT